MDTKALKEYGLDKHADVLKALFSDWKPVAERAMELAHAPSSLNKSMINFMNTPGVLPTTAKIGRGALNFLRSVYLGNPMDYAKNIKNLAHQINPNPTARHYAKAVLKEGVNPVSIGLTGYGAYQAFNSDPGERGAATGGLIANTLATPLYNLSLPGMYAGQKITDLGRSIGAKFDSIG